MGIVSQMHVALFALFWWWYTWIWICIEDILLSQIWIEKFVYYLILWKSIITKKL